MMKKVLRVLLLGLVVFSLFLVTSASAKDVGGYFNISVGQSDWEDSFFDDGTSFSLGLGYSLNRNFAIEANYIDFGEADDGIPPVWTVSGNAFVANIVGKLPLGERFAWYAKLGIASWEAEIEEDGFGLIAEGDGTDATYAVGMMLGFSENVSFNIQYQKYELDDVDLDNTSLGLQFSF